MRGGGGYREPHPQITPRPRAIDGEGVFKGAGLVGRGGTLCHTGGGACPVVVQT